MLRELWRGLEAIVLSCGFSRRDTQACFAAVCSSQCSDIVSSGQALAFIAAKRGLGSEPANHVTAISAGARDDIGNQRPPSRETSPHPEGNAKRHSLYNADIRARRDHNPGYQRVDDRS